MPINWDDAKPVIHNLYVTQKRTLRNVQQSLYKNHGFSASTRSYRGKLKQWGYIRRQDTVGHGPESQVQHSLQSTSGPLSGASYTISDLSLQRDTLTSSTNYATPWLPDMSNYGTSPSQIEQLPLNFGNFSPNSYILANGAISHHSGSTPMNPATPPHPLPPLDSIDERGRTSLHRAVLKRSLEETERQLAIGLNPNAPDAEGQCPLHFASERGWVDIIRLLLKRGANSKIRNKLGKSPLHLAVKFPKAVKVLLTSHPEVSALDNNRNSPLHMAILAASLSVPLKNSVIEQLIDAGADMDIQNEEGKSSFELILGPTASRGKYHSQYVIFFLDRGANILIPLSMGKLPFEYLVENILDRLTLYDYKTGSSMRNLDVKMFIEKGASCDVTLPSGKSILNTFKDKTTRAYDYELVPLLCKTVSITTADSDGEYPLHCIFRAPSYSSVEILLECMEILLQRGADINQKNQTGDNPLAIFLKTRITYSFGAEIITDFLLKQGANPVMSDSKNDVPIFIASQIKDENRRQKVVKLLLDAITSDKSIEEWWANTAEVAELSSFEWWTACLHFLNNAAWTDPTELKNQSTLPPEQSEYIVNTVLSYGAQKYLELSKTNFENLKQTNDLSHIETQEQSSQIVRILRDCDKHKIEVDSSWYRYLLNLFD